MKIATTTEDRGVLDLQNQALLHLERHAPAVRVPRLVPASDGAYEAVESDATGRPHVVRLLTWVPGRVLADVSPHTADLLRGLGVMLGTIDRALASCDRSALTRSTRSCPSSSVASA